MDKLINITDGVYWIVLDCLGSSGGLVVHLLPKVHRNRLQSSKNTGLSSDLLMPTLSNLVCLPIVSTLENVYLCFKGTSNSFYTLFTFRYRQFNYDRLNMWQILLMVAMLSLATAAHISTSTDYSTQLVTSLAVEYALLGALG